MSDPRKLESAQSQDEEPSWKASDRDWLMVFCFSLDGLLVTMDATILVSILPTLAESLHGTSIDASWAGSAYLLTCAVSQPFYMTLADILNWRGLFTAAMGLFALGTLLCCLANGFQQLHAGRAIQGMGAGGLMCLPLLMVAYTIPLRQRPKFNGIILLTGIIGAVLGPVIGGLFVDRVHNWRWVFYINFPCALFIILPLWFLRQFADQQPPPKSRLLGEDWFGGILFLGSTSSFLIGIIWGGVQFPWSSWRTYVPIAVGGLGMVATILWERFVARNPLIRLQLFQDHRALAAYISIFFQGLLLFCELYYVPLYFQSAKHFSPIMSGVALMPITAAICPSTGIAGALITRFNHPHRAVWLAWVMTVTATGCMILFDQETKTWQWIVILAVAGAGHGIKLSALSICVQALVNRQKDSGYAAAMYAFARSFGMCIGVPIGGTAFGNTLKHHAGKLGLPAQISSNAEAGIEAARYMHLSGEEMNKFREAYAMSFQNLAEVLTAIAVLGLISGCLVRRVSLGRK